LKIIGREEILEAVSRDQTLEGPLGAWYRVAAASTWKNLVEVRRTYPTADYVEPLTVFNVRGNKYRLIVRIDYAMQLIQIRHVPTHAEYDRGRWGE
jgi:mRNA interferase HigB